MAQSPGSCNILLTDAHWKRPTNWTAASWPSEFLFHDLLGCYLILTYWPTTDSIHSQSWSPSSARARRSLCLQDFAEVVRKKFTFLRQATVGATLDAMSVAHTQGSVLPEVQLPLLSGYNQQWRRGCAELHLNFGWRFQVRWNVLDFVKFDFPNDLKSKIHFIWGGCLFCCFFSRQFLDFFRVPVSMLSCFSDFPASLLFWFLLFLLLCFSASLFSLLLCFCTSVPFYFYYSTFSFLQSCVFAAPLPAPLLLCFLSLLSLCFSFSLLYSVLFVS